MEKIYVYKSRHHLLDEGASEKVYGKEKVLGIRTQPSFYKTTNSRLRK